MIQQPATSRMEQQRHELLLDLAHHVAQVLIDHGVEAPVAEQAGIAAADHLASHWGGQLINFPKDYKFGIAVRDSAIWEQFTGNNYSDLARQYGMTVRGIYKLVSRVKQRETTRKQARLF